jgi:hypothetical protein
MAAIAGAPSGEAFESLAHIRQDHLPATLGELPGVEAAVARPTAGFRRTRRQRPYARGGHSP